MAVTAQNVIDAARSILQDTSGSTGTYYLVADMLKDVNEGQKEMVRMNLSFNPVRESVQMIAGSKQSIPSDSAGLISITRNMGTAGTSPGKSIRRIERKVLDDLVPDWHYANPSATTKFYVYEPEKDESHFDIYPPMPSGNLRYLEMIHGGIPDDILIGGDILDDTHKATLINYVLYRRYSQDSENGGDNGLAEAYRAKFEKAILEGK